MARYEFKLPDIGEGVTEGEIVAWGEGVNLGASIQTDQTLAEIMTDKATVTIPSPKAGKVVQLGGDVGQVVKVGQVLVVLETEGEASASAPTPQAANAGPTAAAPTPPPAPAKAAPPPPAPEPVKAAPPPPAPAPEPAKVAPAPAAPAPSGVGEKTPAQGPSATAAGSIPETLPGMPSDEEEAGPPSAQSADKPLAAPATRQLARELGVDLRQVRPTGPHGRVTQEDVRQFAQGGAQAQAPAQAQPAQAPAQAPSQAAAAAPAAAPSAAAHEPIRIGPPPAGQGQGLEERVPLRGVRKKIFEQMARSKHTAAHFTFVEECDVTQLMALRSRLLPLAKDSDVKLSYLPFIIKACVAALKKHPILNTAFDESTQEIVYRKYYNIGIAAATDAGLMVPVVQRADAKSLLEVAKDVERLSSDARSGKIKREDITGSTFTITSLGALGGLFATPILNFPEVAILGVHQIKEKPVVRDGQIVIGKVMLLSLSFDHRIIDGHIGAAFAYEVIRYLENPDRLMLEMV